MSKKLYVGNLPFAVTNEKLKELFSPYGEVEDAQVIVFKATGRSKGFGFVSLKNDAQAEKAIAEMNGRDIDGRKIVVNVATPFDPNKPPRERRFGRSFGRRPFNRDEGRRGPRRAEKEESTEPQETEETEHFEEPEDTEEAEDDFEEEN
jgi:RNA recognition motif-containing protein